MSEFQLKRLGMLMEPEPGNPHVVGGVLNPATARGPGGELYLFPRLVGKDNFSRIGIVHVENKNTSKRRQALSSHFDRTKCWIPS